MMGYMVAKSVLKAFAAWSIAAACWRRRAGLFEDGCIFNYHRVCDPGCVDSACDGWNVRPRQFKSQAKWIAENAKCVPLYELVNQVASSSTKKPLVTLTFDDGFANFRHDVLPILEEFGLSATLFVVTKHVGISDPYPFDGWGKRNRHRSSPLSWRPITWSELEACQSSGLVSIGSHSHTHPKAQNCRAAELETEAAVSWEILHKRLGHNPTRSFAYPYGHSRGGDVPPAYVQAVRNAGYVSAVTTDLGLVKKQSPVWTLPRIEITNFDLPLTLRGKAIGCHRALRCLDYLRFPPRPFRGRPKTRKASVPLAQSRKENPSHR